jgi:TolB-like protein/DNA-binding winged helix-turn-helix (wHTH) protein
LAGKLSNNWGIPMEIPAWLPRHVRIGDVSLDVRAGELNHGQDRTRLGQHSLQILLTLLDRPGEVVTREELASKLWPQDTYVDFEDGLNHAIKKLREALGDSPETPRFIETVPRRGYRLIAPVDGMDVPRGAPLLRTEAGEGHQGPAPPNWRRLLLATTILLFIGISTLIAVNVSDLRNWIFGIPLPHIESIAVLPLENLSHDPEQEYFADGMTEELITTLGQVHALRVISRTSVLRYKGTRKPLPEIARELNVDAIVEGTVLRSGNRVRITANLVYAPSDRHLWAESYERDLGDVLSLQDEVARNIANQIKIKLTPQEHARLAGSRPVNPMAHEAYLKGRFFFHNLSKQNVLKAIKYARQAVEVDPDYAAAYGLLASSYWESGVHAWGDLPDREEAEKTRAAATKALEIDDSLAEGHVGLGIVQDTHDWNWAGAEREFRRAIELNSNFARAHAMYAWHLLFVGRWDQSIQEAKRASELDPFSAHILMTVTAIHYFTRHYDQALEYARRWLEIFPESSVAYRHFWYVYRAMGKYDEAVAALQKAMTLEGASPKDVEALGRAYQAGGMRGVWRWILEDRKNRGVLVTAPHAVAIIYSHLGEKDKALEWLEKGYRQHDHTMVFIKTNYEFGPFRSDPRFQSLLRRMNFPSTSGNQKP